MCILYIIALFTNHNKLTWVFYYYYPVSLAHQEHLPPYDFLNMYDLNFFHKIAYE